MVGCVREVETDSSAFATLVPIAKYVPSCRQAKGSARYSSWTGFLYVRVARWRATRVGCKTCTKLRTGLEIRRR